MREKTAPFSRSASENKMENKVELALRIFEMKDFLSVPRRNPEEKKQK
jgi:hypothetical protein